MAVPDSHHDRRRSFAGMTEWSRESARPLQLFLRTEGGSASLLLAATLVALVWANSPLADAYEDLWATEMAVSIGSAAIREDLRHWVNDGLMVLFFFVVGLEIRRELAMGELTERRQAALPALAALAGMVVPALLYLALNAGGDGARGWGIVMATDIAFVVGLLALVGPSAPSSLRLFLLTLAIVDDIGAISVMALFYSGDLDLTALAVSGVLVAVLVGLRWMGVWRLAPYVVTGLALWLAVHASGVHATLAGVLVGLLLPSKPTTPDVLDRTRDFGRALREAPDPQRAKLARLAVAATVPAGARLQQTLHRWTAYGVVPVFGVANAGVPLDLETLRTAATSPVTLGIAAALVVGNAIGITAGAAVALRTGWGVLPGGVRWSHLMAGATLAGIGFTISLFITDLAFADDRLREQATIGILTGSVVAALAGVVLLRVLGERFSLCSPESEGPPALPPRPWLQPSVPA